MRRITTEWEEERANMRLMCTQSLEEINVMSVYCSVESLS